MLVSFDRENKKYGFFLGLVAILIILGLAFSGSSEMGMVDGLKNLLSHHQLTDSDSFYYGGISAAFINSGLTLLIPIIFFYLTKTKIHSTEFAALVMVAGYSFYGKNIFNSIPLMVGAYIYPSLHGETLESKSAIAAFSASLGPIVSSLAFGVDVLKPGSPLAIIIAILAGILCGYLVSWVSDWMPAIIKSRSILLGAACAGAVAIVAAGVINALGLGLPVFTDPPTVDQAYYTRIVIAMAIVLGYFLLMGLLSGAKIKDFARIQSSKDPSTDLIGEDERGFSVALVNSGLAGLILLLYFVLLPSAKMHGEIWAGVATFIAFIPKGLTFALAAPFLIGMIGFNFLSAGIAGLIGGSGFIASGLEKIASRGVLMGTFVGSNIAPLNHRIGPRRLIRIAVVYALIVPRVSGLYMQTLLYNSGFAVALTVILYNVTENHK